MYNNFVVVILQFFIFVFDHLRQQLSLNLHKLSEYSTLRLSIYITYINNILLCVIKIEV